MIVMKMLMATMIMTVVMEETWQEMSMEINAFII